jgi:hypothetical protein
MMTWDTANKKAKYITHNSNHGIYIIVVVVVVVVITTTTTITITTISAFIRLLPQKPTVILPVKYQGIY